MIEFVPFEKRYKYPHMGKEDTAIWERFIEQNPQAFPMVAYDVAVGTGSELDTVVNQKTGGDVNRLYQRKIDALGETPTEFILIEVKPNASTSAIGQVQGYVELFKRDYQPAKAVRAMILTDRLLPEMEFLTRTAGVTIMIA